VSPASKADAAERGGLQRVLTGLLGGRVKNLHTTELGLADDSDAEFGFCVADPALSGEGLIHDGKVKKWAVSL
jgi:hypothetical protein